MGVLGWSAVLILTFGIIVRVLEMFLIGFGALLDVPSALVSVMVLLEVGVFSLFVFCFLRLEGKSGKGINSC